MHPFKISRHVGPFGYRGAAVGNQHSGVFAEQLVLRCTRQGNIARHAPRGFASMVCRPGKGLTIVLDPAAAVGLVRLDPVNLFLAQPVGIVNEPARIR